MENSEDPDQLARIYSVFEIELLRLTMVGIKATHFKAVVIFCGKNVFKVFLRLG